jgi:hypothetical protein
MLVYKIWGVTVSNTDIRLILFDIRIGEYQTIKIIFKKNNYRYVSDTSSIHVSEKYRENNVSL